MKLIQLNVERDRHVDRFIPFLRSEDADIVCLQEVTRRTYDRLCKDAGYVGVFVPITRIYGYEEGSDGQEIGPAILTRHTIVDTDTIYYAGEEGFVGHNEKQKPETYIAGSRVVVIANIALGERVYRVGSTHFTWSEKGINSPLQEKHLDIMLGELANRKPLDLFTGDFNIPRGTGFYHMLAERFRDTVPEHIETTLDQTLHRKPGLQYVVDYIWTTSDIVDEVQVVCGVSDHCALIATVK